MAKKIKLSKKTTKRTVIITLIGLLLIGVLFIIYFTHYSADSTSVNTSTTCKTKDPAFTDKEKSYSLEEANLITAKRKTSQTQIGSLLKDMKVTGTSSNQSQIHSLLQDIKTTGTSSNQSQISSLLEDMKSDTLLTCPNCKKNLETQAKQIIKSNLQSSKKEIESNLNSLQKDHLNYDLTIPYEWGSSNLSSKIDSQSTTLQTGADRNIKIVITTKPSQTKTSTFVKTCSKKRSKSITTTSNVSVTVEITVPNSKKPYKFKCTSSTPIKSSITIPLN